MCWYPKSLFTLRRRDNPIPLRSAVTGRDHPSTLCGAGVWPSLYALRCWGVTIPLCSEVRGPSLSTLRCHPSSFFALRCWGVTIPLCCQVRGPSLSNLRCHPSSLCGAGARPSIYALRCWVHPSPLCGAIHLHSAMSVRSNPSPLYGIGTFPSLHHSAVLGRDHPSTVCGAGAIHLHSAVPSISALRYRDVSIPPPFGGARARPSLSGLRYWGLPSPLCGAGAIPSLFARRY